MTPSPLGTLLAIAASVCTASARAQDDPAHARVRLVSEWTELAPGKENWLGLAFEIDPGWHVYWNGLNDTGMPIEAKLTLPEGWTAGEIQWPAPRRLVSPGPLLDHVYEDKVTLLVPVTVPADAKGGERFEIAADLEWLVCKTACVLESARVAITLPVAAPEKTPTSSADAGRIAQTRERLPRALPGAGSPGGSREGSPATGAGVVVAWKQNDLTITSKGATGLAFYPGAKCTPLVDAVGDAEVKSGAMTLRFQPPVGHGALAEGVLEIREGPERKAARWYRVRSFSGFMPKGGESGQ